MGTKEQRSVETSSLELLESVEYEAAHDGSAHARHDDEQSESADLRAGDRDDL